MTNYDSYDDYSSKNNEENIPIVLHLPSAHVHKHINGACDLPTAVDV